MKRYQRVTKEIERKVIEMREKGIKYICIAYDLEISVGNAHKIFKKHENIKAKK